MKESEQVKLSRYIDSELSPLERKGVEAALESDPAARRMASEYALIRQYIKELPREPLGADLVPALQAARSRKPWFISIPTKSPAISGILAASVLIACFSVAGYVAMNSDPVAPGSQHERKRNSDYPSTGVTQSQPQSPIKLSDPESDPISVIKSKVEEKAETPQPQIAMAPPRSAGGLAAPRVESTALGKIAIRGREAASPEAPSGFRGKTDEAAPRIDRRHSLRLHVASASDRQIDSILSVIGQFRAANSSVMERERPTSGDKPESLAFIALIPTGQFHNFQERLRNLDGIELEIDKPEERIFRKAELSDGFRAVDNEMIERAISATGKVVPEANAPQPGPHKTTKIVEAVPDAISQPLKVDVEAGEVPGTLDQVLVLIRTDPLRIEGKESKSSRKTPVEK